MFGHMIASCRHPLVQVATNIESCMSPRRADATRLFRCVAVFLLVYVCTNWPCLLAQELPVLEQQVPTRDAENSGAAATDTVGGDHNSAGLNHILQYVDKEVLEVCGQQFGLFLALADMYWHYGVVFDAGLATQLDVILTRRRGHKCPLATTPSLG